jgi:hypothetical protein
VDAVRGALVVAGTAVRMPHAREPLLVASTRGPLDLSALARAAAASAGRLCVVVVPGDGLRVLFAALEREPSDTPSLGSRPRATEDCWFASTRVFLREAVEQSARRACAQFADHASGFITPGTPFKPDRVACSPTGLFVETIPMVDFRDPVILNSLTQPDFDVHLSATGLLSFLLRGSRDAS